MTQEQKENRANDLYWSFTDWLKDVRLNSLQREKIESIINEFKKIVIKNYY